MQHFLETSTRPPESLKPGVSTRLDSELSNFCLKARRARWSTVLVLAVALGATRTSKTGGVVMSWWVGQCWGWTHSAA